MNTTLVMPDLAATESFGRRLAGQLRPPLVVGLVGDLGTGKTTLVRALIQALSPGQRVKSPTYTLVESYDLPGLQLHHLDLYRLRHPDELEELGLSDLLTKDAAMLIEWPDKGGASTPPLDLEIRLFRSDEHARELTLIARTPAGESLRAAMSCG